MDLERTVLACPNWSSQFRTWQSVLILYWSTNWRYLAWLCDGIWEGPSWEITYKSEYYSISGSTLQWIREFLCSKIQRVLVDGKSSHTAPVQSGVSQGGVMWATHVPPVYKLPPGLGIVIYSSSICRWLCIVQKNLKWSRLETTTGRYEQLAQMGIWLAKEFHPSKYQLLRVSHIPQVMTDIGIH